MLEIEKLIDEAKQAQKVATDLENKLTFCLDRTKVTWYRDCNHERDDGRLMIDITSERDTISLYADQALKIAEYILAMYADDGAEKNE